MSHDQITIAALAVLGLFMVGYAVKGIMRRRLVIPLKGGGESEYTGRAAVYGGIIVIALGVALIVAALLWIWQQD